MAEKRLTKEIAEQFLADDESVNLEEFTDLDDDAAEILSRFKGDLELNGLTSLSDAASESLSEHKASLEMAGLTQLSDSAAKCLSRHSGNALSLGGYHRTTFDAVTAQMIRDTTDGSSLSGDISPTAVMHLTEYKGSLSLDIATLNSGDSPEWAKALSEFGKRPEQRLFLAPTARMEEVLEQKDLRDWAAFEECFDVPGIAFAVSERSHLHLNEICDRLERLVIETGMRKLWSVAIENNDNGGGSDHFYFIGEEPEVLETMTRLPDKTE